MSIACLHFPVGAEPLVDDACLLFQIELAEGTIRVPIPVDVHVAEERGRLVQNRATHETRQKKRRIDLPGMHELVNKKLPGRLLSGFGRVTFSS